MMNRLNKTIVIGDLHGGYNAIVDVLNKVNLSKDCLLIFLGDYVDGWSDSPKLLDFLIDLKESHQCVFLRGNHDQLFLDWLTTKVKNPLWLRHGGASTIKAYKGVSKTTIVKHIDFLKSLEYYYLDTANRLFVHAGFTNPNGIEHEYFSKMFFWDRTLWETALCLDPKMSTCSEHYPKRFNLYKEIFIGHTPVTRIGVTEPVHKANIWNIDTGAAFRGPITAMDVDTKQFWQSRPVFEYYPDEKGRN